MGRDRWKRVTLTACFLFPQYIPKSASCAIYSRSWWISGPWTCQASPQTLNIKWQGALQATNHCLRKGVLPFLPYFYLHLLPDGFSFAKKKKSWKRIQLHICVSFGHVETLPQSHWCSCRAPWECLSNLSALIHFKKTPKLPRKKAGNPPGVCTGRSQGSPCQQHRWDERCGIAPSSGKLMRMLCQGELCPKQMKCKLGTCAKLLWSLFHKCCPFPMHAWGILLPPAQGRDERKAEECREQVVLQPPPLANPCTKHQESLPGFGAQVLGWSSMDGLGIPN